VQGKTKFSRNDCYAETASTIGGLDGKPNGPVKSGASHAKARGNLGNGDICCFEQGADGFYLFSGEFGWATSIATAGARRLETGYGSFTNQVALELREGGEDVEY
jgi:hypothetical protein